MQNVLLKHNNASQTNRGNIKCREVIDLGEMPSSHVDVEVVWLSGIFHGEWGNLGYGQGVWKLESILSYLKKDKLSGSDGGAMLLIPALWRHRQGDL